MYKRQVLRRGIQRRDVLLTAVLMGGIALFFLDELSPGHLSGNLLALFSGVLMAINTLYARYSGTDVIEYGMVSCCLLYTSWARAHSDDAL